MSSIDISVIEKTLQSLLLPDNVIRKQAESQIGIWMQSKESFSLYLSQVLLASNDTQVKSYCAIIIRKIYINKDDTTWEKASPESKAAIKTNLLNALIQTQDAMLQKKIADAIIAIYELIEDAYEEGKEGQENWNDLILFTNKGFTLELNEVNSPMINICLYLLSNIYVLFDDQKKNNNDLYINAFKHYFTSNSLMIKAKTVHCLSELLSGIISKKETKKFAPLIFYILETTLQCFNAKDHANLSTCLNAFNDLAEEEPKLFRKSFGDVFILIGKITESHDIEDNLREIAFEILISILGEMPKVIKKDKDKLTLLIQSIFKYAMEIDDSIDEDWTTPVTDSYMLDEFIPEHKLDEAVSLLTRLLDTLDEKTVLEIISSNIIELLKHSSDKEWKYKYIAYIVISSISTYIKGFDSIKKIVDVIVNDLSNANVKVQYAVLMCIADFSEDFNPDFQSEYYKKIMPQLINIFQTTNVLRIKLQLCDAMDLFIENLPEEESGTYTQSALDCLFNVFLRNDSESPCALKEGILAVVSTICEFESKAFKQYADKAFKILLEYLAKILKENINRNLIGALFELIAAIGPSCPELLTNYLSTLVETILQIQCNIVSFKENIANYLHSTWERILPLIISTKSELMPKIIESYIHLLKNPPQMSTASNPQVQFSIAEFFNDEAEKEKDKSSTKREKNKVDLTTSETEEYSTYIETLNLILKEIPQAFINSIDMLYTQSISLLAYPNQDIQLEIANTFSLLLIVVSKANDQALLHAKAKVFISDIITHIEKKSSFSITVAFLDSVQSMINTAGMFLTVNEINLLCGRVIEIFNSTETLRLSLIKSKDEAAKQLTYDKTTGENKIYPDDEYDEDDDAGSDEEVINHIKDSIEEVEAVQTSISEFFGCLFKTHKQLSLEIVDKLIKEYLPKYLRNESSVFEKQLGLLIVIDMIQYLGQDIIGAIWTDIAKILLTYVTHSDNELKQSASYGIGLFAQFTTANFDLYAKEMIDGLDKGLIALMQSNDKRDDEWESARDNIVSAIGKIIKYQGKVIDVNALSDKWINLMPLKEDFKEGKLMSDFLIEILQKNSMLVIGDGNKNLAKVIEVLCKIYDTSHTTEECDIHIKDILRKLNSNIEMQNVIKSVIAGTKKEAKRKKMMKIFE